MRPSSPPLLLTALHLLSCRVVPSSSFVAPAASLVPPAPSAPAALRMAAGDAGNDAPPLTKTRPRKICLMVEPTPFTHVSGYSNRFNEMLRYLRQAGDQVEILTTDDLRSADGSAVAAEKVLPTEAFGYPIEHTQGFRFPLYNHIVLSFDLPELKGLRMLERFQPELIHVSSPSFLCSAAILYGRIMRIPVVASYHTHLPVYARNYMGHIPLIQDFAWTLIRFIHNRADLTLVTSPQIKKELEDEGVERVDVWRKGIDTVKFDPKFKSAEMRHRMSEGHPDDFLMVYIGRLGAEKRLKEIKGLLARLPNSRACIVGGGPQEAELHDHFKGTKTHFTGQLTGDDLSAAFASADVFIMPSDSETLGFVVLESMASGVPVVAARAGGIVNLITDGEDGYLCEPGNEDAYLERLVTLKEDAEFRNKMGQKARKEAERWSWEAATSVLRNVQYERALVNFHMRAFGGFGRPKSGVAWRAFKHRVARLRARVLAVFRLPGFLRRRPSV
eukprot:CAMPEP_0194307654 /NCGR_PEP_ID=MMETSP0171-20130528/4546_1 /TAXON_ID=218684 /ORGANISM="Corethron pennatum, Strain L29A3" /LENGTH=501 /DNA_ID=CAMNT_0039059835 /DNA_START=194 /DNA_END=1699 /DNA_ORIENTATION=-